MSMFVFSVYCICVKASMELPCVDAHVHMCMSLYAALVRLISIRVYVGMSMSVYDVCVCVYAYARTWRFDVCMCICEHAYMVY